MGLFSWTTCDTEESVMNKYSDQHKPVYILRPNKAPILCTVYDGYGRFETDGHGLIDLQDHWIDDIENPDQKIMGYDGLPLKLSFNKNADYNDFFPSLNCPIQGHDWSL